MAGNFEDSPVHYEGPPPMAVGYQFANADDDPQPLIDEVRRQLDPVVKGNLRANYAIGRAFIAYGERFEKERCEASKLLYGSGIFDRVAEAIHVSDPLLRDCHRVATRIEPDEFEATVVENRLAWGHATLLANVFDADRRRELIQEIVEMRLSVTTLAAIIASEQLIILCGPGHAPFMPGNLQQAVNSLEKISKKYCRSMQKLLFGDHFDFDGAIENAPWDTLTEDTRKTIVEYSERLAEIAAIVTIAQRRLQNSVAHFDKSLSANHAFEEAWIKMSKLTEDDSVTQQTSWHWAERILVGGT
jgi:hypothetical protein